jgi:hypothetical protein
MNDAEQYPNFKDDEKYQCIDPNCWKVSFGRELLPRKGTGIWIGNEKRCPYCSGAVRKYL